MPEAEGPSALTRWFAHARLAVGSFWLDAFVRRHRHREPRVVFDLTWAAARRKGRLFSAAEIYRNGHAYSWQSKLFQRVVGSLDRAGVAFVPSVRVQGLELLRSSCGGPRPPMVVMVHSPVDAAINRVFREAGIDWAVLSAKTETLQRRARLYGLVGPLNIVLRDSDSLLAIRRNLAAGKLVCGCVDFTNPPRKTARGHLFVSPTLFDLAKLVRSPVVYADTAVLEDGTIDVTFALPGVMTANATGEPRPEDFIAWLKTTRGDQRDFGVGPWAARQRRRARRSLLRKVSGAARSIGGAG
jgi:hypothetical protein